MPDIDDSFISEPCILSGLIPAHQDSDESSCVEYCAQSSFPLCGEPGNVDVCLQRNVMGLKYLKILD